MKFSKFHTQEKRRIPAEINLTSLVDIIFNLLLFFMLTASIAETPGIEVSLPEASSGKVEKQDSLRIIIASDQSLLVNNKAVSRSDLGKLLQEHKQKSGTRVFLQADKLAAHGNVVQILDLIKKNGILEVAIATESVE